MGVYGLKNVSSTMHGRFKSVGAVTAVAQRARRSSVAHHSIGPRPRALFMFVPPRTPHTGGEAYNRQMLQALRQAGYGVWALPEPGKGLAGVRHTLFRNVMRLPAVVQAVLSGKRVVVVTHLASPSNIVLHFALCRALPRCRIVTMVHHLESDEPGPTRRRARLRLFERAVLMLSDKIIVNSPATARHIAVLGVVGRPVAVVPPGFDVADVSDAGRSWRSPDVRRLLTVGKLTPRKANDQLLLALSLLPDSFVLDLAGVANEPDYARYLHTLVENHGLMTRVSFHGYMTPRMLADLRASADVYVSASVWEGFGMAVAEAMAVGLPVVAVDNEPVRALVTGEGSGIIVPPGDPTALAAAIQRVVSDPTYRERAEARAATVRTTYSWGTMRRSFTASVVGLWD